MCSFQMRAVFGATCLLLAGSAVAQMSVELNLDQIKYIVGEAIRADVRIANHAALPFVIASGDNHRNALVFDVRDSRRDVLESSQPRTPMISELLLPGGETYRGAFELDEWYPMGRPGNYLVTAMLRREDIRYDSTTRAIEIVPGLEIKTVIQLFADSPDFQRKLALVYAERRQSECLFLRITDMPGERTWSTLALGQLLRTTPPAIEISANGDVTILHRASRDVFLKTHVKSTVKGVELVGQEQIVDTHAVERMQAQWVHDQQEADKKKKESHWWWPFGGAGDDKSGK